MKHRARKRFGQHFLVNDVIISQIVDRLSLNSQDHVVEIGPGLGALTHQLSPHVHQLSLIELDRDLAAQMTQQFEGSSKVTIYQKDALTFDFNQLTTPPKRIRVVGNLPYNVSTPLLFHLLGFRSIINDIVVMLQKEVVDRMVAVPSTKAYGRLSIMTQYLCKTESWLEVPPDAFDPPPKVNSAVIHLEPWQTSPYPATNAQCLDRIVSAAFQQRRKTIRNALSHLMDASLIESTGVAATQRPDAISVSQYVALSNAWSMVL